MAKERMVRCSTRAGGRVQNERGWRGGRRVRGTEDKEGNIKIDREKGDTETDARWRQMQTPHGAPGRREGRTRGRAEIYRADRCEQPNEPTVTVATSIQLHGESRRQVHRYEAVEVK